jgi:FkbM family methyltransferase
MIKSYLKRLGTLLRVKQRITTVYGRGSKTLLWLRMIMIVLQPRLPRALRVPQRLDLMLDGKPFSIWMEDRTGLAAFEEVFIRGEYALADIPEPRVVVDAGANIGVASVYFCLRYPGAQLYAVEPDPGVCKTLQKNLAAFPHASVHQCALSDVDGAVDLHVHPTSSIASSLSARVYGDRVVSVSSRTLDTFRNEHGIGTIDLLKFDIEGAEDRMLRSIKDLSAVRFYVGEIHPDLVNSSLEDIIALFKEFAVTVEPIGSKRFLLTAKIKVGD